MENECFPSLVKEGWLRPQFRLLTFTACGDGVVKAKSIRCIFTTSPKSMRIKGFPENQNGLHGFGYSS
jgi:hypothetical protein